VFAPENLLREARRQKRIAKGKVSEICVLIDPDGGDHHSEGLFGTLEILKLAWRAAS
jgi:hypothetical protein